MVERAFPVVLATNVQSTVDFYEDLGFEAYFQMPEDGEPGYVSLKRASVELAVVDSGWSRDQYDEEMGKGPRFEMYVYVADLSDALKKAKKHDVRVIKEPTEMPWGETVAY